MEQEKAGLPIQMKMYGRQRRMKNKSMIHKSEKNLRKQRRVAETGSAEKQIKNQTEERHLYGTKKRQP